MNKARLNTVTGNPEIVIGFEFKSLSQTELTNSNGKKYRIASGFIKNAKGEKQLVTGAMYEGNYSKGTLTAGEELTAVASKVGNDVYIQVSHLPYGGARATLDMFGADAFVVEAPIATGAPASAAEVANAVS